MDAEDFSLRVHALLRRAGLEKVPRAALVGVIVLALVLVLVALWHFWPRPSADFVATSSAVAREADTATQADATVKPTGQIVVDVEGAVVHPGIYTLEEGARVGDAIQAAGGLSPDALAGACNLAQKLGDGEQVIVPSIQESQGDASASTGNAPASARTPDGKININTASADELQELSGVGPSLSERIIDYREKNGRFSSIEELKNVSGIGDTRFDNIKDKIRT